MDRVYDWMTDLDLVPPEPVRWLRAKQIAALLVLAGLVPVVGYVGGSLWAAGATPIVKERKVFVPVIETVNEAASTTEAVPAVREIERRLVLVGDSSLSLWQNEMAAHVATTGRWHGFEVSEVVPVAEEGKLPCYFESFRPVDIRPGDVVAVSFVVTGWHRTESDECRNSVAKTEFYDMLTSFYRYVAGRGGEVVAMAVPDQAAGSMAFWNEPWWPGLSPAEINEWQTVHVGPLVGVECRAATVLDTDGFHVAMAGKDALGACMAGVQ